MPRFKLSLPLQQFSQHEVLTELFTVCLLSQQVSGEDGSSLVLLFHVTSIGNAGRGWVSGWVVDGQDGVWE